MANVRPLSRLLVVLTFVSTILNIYFVGAEKERKTYIVYMGERSNEEYSAKSHHLSILGQVLDDGLGLVKDMCHIGKKSAGMGVPSIDAGRPFEVDTSAAAGAWISSAKVSLVYSYKRSLNGFAAKLTDQEKHILDGMEGVVSVFPSRILKPHTTRSWDFMGFSTSVKRHIAIENDIIIGMIDTGIWPESESFSDEGLGPPPSKWKGTCQNFTCNNKIIGARFYKADNKYSEKEGPSPRDVEGHGSHTASTVAGSEIKNTSLYGLAQGTVRGAVPSARIAVYKVCWFVGCMDHDVLAAFDDAISDGVDILSVSLGGDSPADYFSDPIAIGAFHAMKKGILTSTSAGNDGPDLGSVANVAPWMLSVAASTMDRKIISKVSLGNNITIVGNAINTFTMEKRLFPFIYGGDAGNHSDLYSRFCYTDSLDKDLVKGKIVLCEMFSEGNGPYLAGAQGIVMVDDYFLDVPMSFPLPTTLVSPTKGKKLMEYLNKTRNPMANIHKSEEIFDSKAPLVASFSSRGPNTITFDILKPDVIAPGVDILAAWSPKGFVSMSVADTRSVKYNIISGTSMACPHATGAAAYIKAFHPAWSPAAIMSALITTASPMNATNNPNAEFAYGSGEIDPLKAVHPGLVYDALEGDYIQFLCNLGYKADKIKLVSGDNVTCPKATNEAVKNLNYPSMAVAVAQGKPFMSNFSRTVTNVGTTNSTYRAIISHHSQLNITVNPSVLSFKSLHEKHDFLVTVSGGALPIDSLVSVSIVWSDGKHNVRSPLVVHTYNHQI